jgi:hypothetical protein
MCELPSDGKRGKYIVRLLLSNSGASTSRPSSIVTPFTALHNPIEAHEKVPREVRGRSETSSPDEWLERLVPTLYFKQNNTNQAPVTSRHPLCRPVIRPVSPVRRNRVRGTDSG